MNTQNLPTTSTKAILITGVSIVLGLLFDYFFYGKIPGIAFPVYVGLIILGLLVIVNFLKIRISREILWPLIPLIFFSTMVFIRSSALLTILNIAASLVLMLVITEVALGRNVNTFLIRDYIRIFFLPFEFVRPLFQTLSRLFSSHGAHNDTKVASQVIRGILLAIPVLFVFLLLFSSADLIFQQYVSGLITIDIEPETIFRAILVLVATLAYIGAYAYLFREGENQATVQPTSTKHRFGHIESSILLGSVNTLFFLFILIQLTYLFGGESNISAQGFTYAEYARRGFFELIAVAIISFLLLLTTEQYVVKQASNHVLGFKVLSTTLVIQVMVIMASAFIRLSLYEQAYGFTILRLYSHAFIILLAAIFCVLLYKIHIDKRENTFAFRIATSIILFLAAMNAVNPDAFVARRNIERFDTTGKLDIYYLGQLSDDAIPETIKVLDISDEDLRKGFARELYMHAQNNNAPYLSKWQSWNIARMRANSILDSKMQDLEPYKDYQQQDLDTAKR